MYFVYRRVNSYYDFTLLKAYPINKFTSGVTFKLFPFFWTHFSSSKTPYDKNRKIYFNYSYEPIKRKWLLLGIVKYRKKSWFMRIYLEKKIQFHLWYTDFLFIYVWIIYYYLLIHWDIRKCFKPKYDYIFCFLTNSKRQCPLANGYNNIRHF